MTRRGPSVVMFVHWGQLLPFAVAFHSYNNGGVSGGRAMATVLAVAMAKCGMNSELAGPGLVSENNAPCTQSWQGQV